MNIISTIKTLPLISLFAISLALSATPSIADNAKHERNKSQYSQDRGKSQNYGHRQNMDKGQRDRQVSHVSVTRDHKKRNHKYPSGSHHRSAHTDKRHHKQGNHVYRNNHSGHVHRNHVNHDHMYLGQHIGLENLRFMFGLHTGNFDIIFRD